MPNNNMPLDKPDTTRQAAICRKQLEPEKPTAASASDHDGDTGRRITLKVATKELITYRGPDGKTMEYHFFVDESGNVFYYFSPRVFYAADGATIEATVLNQEEKDGVKYTRITRCMVV